jgi:hypothetical protein
MPRLKPLNAATCTKCGSKKTKRLGYSPQKKGSVWACEDGQHLFVVPLLVFKKAAK